MTVEEAYYIGWAEALLYAQAHNDVEGGSQTLTTHLPQPDYIPDELGFKFDKDKVGKAIDDLDSEGGIAGYRYGKDQWGSDTIEVAGSEGHHGFPEWE